MEKPNPEKTREQLIGLKKTLSILINNIDDIIVDTYPKGNTSEMIMAAILQERRFLHSKEIYYIVRDLFGRGIYYPVLRATLHKMNEKQNIVRIKDGSRFYHGLPEWLNGNGIPLSKYNQQEVIKSKQWQNY